MLFTSNVNIRDTLSDVTGVLMYSFGNYKVIYSEPYSGRRGMLQER